MCGIAGIYASGRPIVDARETLAAMLASIAHRGPDASGIEVDDGLALGAVRLAIVDLDGGDQPYYSEDRDVVVVFNGEIYNYEPFIEDLSSRHRLASRCDGEVLVHLYEEEGIDFVERLDGMFAFALWDRRRRLVHIARDRFGVKPLYYRWDGHRLAFSSEVRALVAGGMLDPRLDADAALELLTFQNIVSGRSLFDGVRLLPAGSVLTIGTGEPSVRRYWDPLPTHDGGADVDSGEAAEGLRDAFLSAVRRQLTGDVEFASYLSGGLDTGAVTLGAARDLPRLTTFVAGFDTSLARDMEAGFDERSAARGLASELGTHHHEMRLAAPDMPMVLGRVVKHLEEPRMSFSYPNFLVAGVASRWTKVVLSGAGGDELLGGYPWRYEYADRPNFRDAYFGYWNRLIHRDELEQALAPEFAARVDLDQPRHVFDDLLEPVADLPPLDQILYYEFRTFLHGLLVLEDKLSMAHSLEVRVPFLDNGLVDYLLGLPAATKIGPLKSKDLFREAMRGLLPEPVRTRSKTGFTPPQAAWMRGPQREYIRSVLLCERSLGRGVLRPEYVARVIEEHESERRDRRLLIWTLLCLEWWHRIFVDGEYVA
jgi:asparagine synthase (glutamine-hydrolysing)